MTIIRVSYHCVLSMSVFPLLWLRAGVWVMFCWFLADALAANSTSCVFMVIYRSVSIEFVM